MNARHPSYDNLSSLFEYESMHCLYDVYIKSSGKKHRLSLVVSLHKFVAVILCLDLNAYTVLGSLQVFRSHFVLFKISLSAGVGLLLFAMSSEY